MTLWHYCSNEAFAGIIQNRSLRLSDLTLSNDSMEGRWIGEILNESIAAHPQVSHIEGEGEQWLSVFKQLEKAIGFCMTQNDEESVLGQWYAYGDSGHGVSIGFNESQIEMLVGMALDLEIRLESVEYNRVTQREQADELLNDANVVNYLMRSREDVALKAPGVLSGGMKVQQFMSENLFLWKPDGFRDEREKRIITVAGINLEEGSSLQHLSLAGRKSSLAPFKLLGFKDLMSNIIDKVILGPKNQTDANFLEVWMQRRGYSSVKVEKSTLPLM